MAISPEIDAMAAQVANLHGLADAVNSAQPIRISIGTFTLDVDPTTTPDAYSQGASLLRSVAGNMIAQLYAQIAPLAVQAALQPDATPTTPTSGA